MISFPFDIDEPEITAGALENLHDLAVGSPTGGMYPVGANGLWHGGLHLSLGKEPPVYACAPGHIVAARLDPDAERATCAYGHTNFILTKHTWPPAASGEKGTPFFVLYMHLAPKSLERVAQRADTAPWLTGEPLLRVTASSGLNVRSEPRPDGTRDGGVPRGDLVKPRGEPTDRAGYRWQEIQVLRQDLEGHLALGPLKNGTVQERWTEKAPPPGGSDLVGKLEGGTVANLEVPVEAGEMLWRGGRFGQDLSGWDEELLELFAEAMGYPEPTERAPTVHWEIFSPEKAFGLEEGEGASQGGSATGGKASNGEASNGEASNGKASNGEAGEAGALSMPSWTEKKDAGSVLTFDPEKSEALSLIKEKRQAAEDLPDEEDYSALSLDEKKTIHLVEAGQELRTYAVKYASEWGLDTGGLKKALKESPAHDPEADKADFEAFQFWSKVKELPESPKVWHYHPVTALRALAAKQPRFFVKANGKRHFVDRYEEMRDVVFETNDVSASTIFDLPEDADNEEEVTQPDAAEMLEETTAKVLLPDGSTQGLASGEIDVDNGWTGVATKGSGPSLYELLIDPASEQGIPKMDDIHKNVWAALTPVEGNLNAVNAYDRAFLSFGPLQQTLGEEGNKGELQGALEATRLRCPDRYDQYFGRHGLLPTEVEPSAGVDKGHVSLRGKTLGGPGGKQRLQAFRWIYRFKQAIEDRKFRKAFLRYGFERLPTILSKEVSLSVEVQAQTQTLTAPIGEIFRSDLGRALLLDTHINGPFYVWPSKGNIWREQTETRLEEWGIADLDSPLTKSQERQLILDLIDQRNASGMWQPPVRAAKILYYTELPTIHRLVIEAGYSEARTPQNVTDEERNAFLDEKIGLASSEPNGMGSFNRNQQSRTKDFVRDGFRNFKTGKRHRDDLLSFRQSALLNIR